MKTTLVALAALLAAGITEAELMTVSGDQTAGTGVLTINQDMTFTITQASTATLLFIFDEVVTADASATSVETSGLEWSINGGQRYTFTRWLDNLGYSTADLTANDGWLQAAGRPAVAQGDTITLHAGSLSMTAADSDFNPWSSGDYNLFIADSSGNRISSDAVPEPATAGLLGLSALALFGLRRLRAHYRLS